MSRRLYNEVVSGTSSDLEVPELPSTWLEAYQDEDEYTAFQKALSLSKVICSFISFYV